MIGWKFRGFFRFFRPKEGFSENFARSSDGLKLYYREYSGSAEKLPVLCLPGLTRNSRDFAFIAEHIRRVHGRRVLCMDLRGRGRSDYDPNWRNYTVPVETADVFALMTQAHAPRVILLGTSRGGLIAMIMASMKGALQGVILNDIGPQLSDQGLDLIRDHTGREPAYGSWSEVVAALKASNSTQIAGLSERGWLEFAKARFIEKGGKIVADYDPKLGDATREPTRTPTAPNLWPFFAALANTPTLLLHGENSYLLTKESVEKMKAAKPDLTVVTVKGRGHVPFLDEPEAVAAIDDFLKRLD